jgi:hypothetical protein
MKKYIFAPTGEHFPTQKDLDEAAQNFFQGDLSEEYAFYVAKRAIHAFWINYKQIGHKVKKEDFQKCFTAIINEVLKKVE